MALIPTAQAHLAAKPNRSDGDLPSITRRLCLFAVTNLRLMG